MHRRCLLAIGILCLVGHETFAAVPAKPNVLVILADDLGYGELGCQGFTPEIPTPNVDSIAKNGVRFTSGYVSGPYCSPTRAGLLTGRYQTRFGHEFNPGPAQSAATTFGLPLSETTIADRLKTAGYTTGWFGKSHLGYAPPFHPFKRGFDEYYGFLGGAHSYLDASADAANPILRGTTPTTDIDGYTTDAFAREAVKFIDHHKSGPWFCYLAFNAVHGPLEATEKYLSRFPNVKDNKRLHYAAMQSAMDDAVGSVLGKIRELGQEENTLIFFVSDNGGPTAQTTSDNGPLRGFKAQTWEGGIRVPFMVQWKGHVPAGKIDDRPVIQLDILPTALAAAGVTAEPGVEAGRRESVALSDWRTGRPAARGPLLALWTASRNPQGRLEIGQGCRRCRYPGNRTSCQGRYGGRGALRSWQRHRRENQSGRPGTVQSQGACRRLEPVEQRERGREVDSGPARPQPCQADQLSATGPGIALDLLSVQDVVELDTSRQCSCPAPS